jgi:ABC-type polysaccharide/polyol phosphate export permease
MTAYFGAIWNCRYFWLSLVRMDLRARYRGSVLGIGWSLLQPICMTIIMCVVFAGVFKQDPQVYAPNLFVGLTFWNYWMAVASQGCNCFFQGEAYIRQFPAPMAIYPLRTMLGSAFHFGVGLVLALLVSTWLHRAFSPVALVSLLPTLGLLLLFGWSVAILFGLATVCFRDTRHLTDVGMQALFYITPVLYPPDMFKDHRKLSVLMELNPLMPFLRLLRDPIVKGEVPCVPTYVSAALIVATVGLAACLAMRGQERKLIFHL